MILNITSKGDWPANVISNFAATPFVLDGIECASAEGFVQALKFPNLEMQREVCRLTGSQAKARGKSATERIIRQQRIWWQNQAYIFRSKEHYELVERGLSAKFTQCDYAHQALLATRNMTLQHNLGYESPHSSLPAKVFIDILTRIRADLLAK